MKEKLKKSFGPCPTGTFLIIVLFTAIDTLCVLFGWKKVLKALLSLLGIKSKDTIKASEVKKLMETADDDMEYNFIVADSDGTKSQNINILDLDEDQELFIKPEPGI